MPNRRDYEAFDTEQRPIQTFISRNKRPLIVVGGSTLLLAGVILAVSLPGSVNSASKGTGGAVGSITQSGGVQEGQDSPTNLNRSVTHKEFLKALCNARRNGTYPWGYWDDHSDYDYDDNDDSVSGDDETSGSVEKSESLEDDNSLESTSSPEEEDESESSGYLRYKWWKNKFIPKRQRLWLEFIYNKNLLRQKHKQISYNKSREMWNDFLKSKNKSKQSKNGWYQQNPFIPEFKKLWLDFLNSSGLLDTKQEHIAHDKLMQNWDDFLEDKGVDSQTVSQSVTESSPDQFLKWWFNQLNSGQLDAVTRPTNSRKKSKPTNHDQFTAWWKQFLLSQTNGGSISNAQNIQERFFNYWLKNTFKKFKNIGRDAAYLKRIPHNQYLNMLCDSLLTGTYDPDYPNNNDENKSPDENQNDNNTEDQYDDNNNENQNDNNEDQNNNYNNDNNNDNSVIRNHNLQPKSVDTALRAAQRVLQSVPLIDGHNDLAWTYRTRIQNHINNIDLNSNVSAKWGLSHTDIPKKKKVPTATLR